MHSGSIGTAGDALTFFLVVLALTGASLNPARSLENAVNPPAVLPHQRGKFAGHQLWLRISGLRRPGTDLP